MSELRLDDGARLRVAGQGWGPQLAGLADAWRLIAFDNRGIGGSTPGAEPLAAPLARVTLDDAPWARFDAASVALERAPAALVMSA